jgi:hypothetical protein
VASVEHYIDNILQKVTDMAELVRDPNEPIKVWLRKVGSQDVCTFPPYWNSVRKKAITSMPESAKYQLLPTEPVYNEVLRVINETFEPNRVGQGYDAPGLKHSKITVQNIWTIENPYLYRQYWEHKKRLCLNSSVNDLPQSMGKLNESEIRTQKVCSDKSKLHVLHLLSDCAIVVQ